MSLFPDPLVAGLLAKTYDGSNVSVRHVAICREISLE